MASDVATTKKVDNDAITRKVELEDWIKDAQVAAKPVGGTREEIVERILATQKGFSPKSDQLMTVAKTLAKLAKKETVPQRVDFLTGYTKDVLRLIKANQAEAEAAVGEAKNNKTNLEKAAETLPTPSNDNPEMN